MSYFARIAARASASSVREAASAASPAMLSQSPLVEHDQRLTLPGFAERALVLDDAPSSAPSPDLGGAEAAPATGPAVTVARKASTPSFTPTAAALGVRTETGGEPASAGIEAFSTRAGAEPRVTAEPRMIAESPRGVAFEPRGVPFVAPPSEVASPGSLPPSARTAPAPPANDAVKPAELAPAARSIFEALSRADAWTRSAPRTEPASASERAHAASEQRPEPSVMTPAAHAAAPEATLGLPDGPSVSIGRLEIEVVAPPRAEPARSPQRLERAPRAAARVAAAASFAAPRAYGWRQR